ncbi:MAG: OmpA family protein [Cyclobacteriaceae bacterium]
MKTAYNALVVAFTAILVTSCVAKKEYQKSQADLLTARNEMGRFKEKLAETEGQLRTCKNDLAAANAQGSTSSSLRQEQIADLKSQIADLKKQRDTQVEQVGNLTVLSKSANDNIKETLSQLEGKDKYINALRDARSKADSINLALSVNLTNVLKEGIADDDVDIKVDKTVVFINLSDKMLYKSGSADITSKADKVLGKIAAIIKAKPDFEVMVEGYTDSLPIKKAGIKDNWDLSVLRSTSVVRSLQLKHDVNPNRLIAAGRGQYNALASNSTPEGRSTNRRTRIIILPKIDQFYDLLKPTGDIK